MSYLAAFVAGVLALLSLALGTGPAAIFALLVAGGFVVAGVALVAADALARGVPRRPTRARAV